jgi:tetratricopeptide (TPR) repeat protein
MIKNKEILLFSILIMMIQVVWTPALWSMKENNGLHWWLIRLPLVLSMPIGIGLFLSSIENKDAYRGGSFSAMNSGDFKTAIDIFDDAIKRNPPDAVLYRSKALALMFAGRDSEAKACIDQSLSIEPNNQLTKSIAEILEDVASGKKSRPKSMKEI